MSDTVQIVEMGSVFVAVGRGFGPEPEHMAWKTLEAWARPCGLLDPAGQRRVYGYNNPNPSAGSPNYGYEFCLTVEPGTQPSGDIHIDRLAGGLYAVMDFEGDPDKLNESVPAAWEKLDAWVARSRYYQAGHQWLEEHSLQGKIVRLYCPIAR